MRPMSLPCAIANLFPCTRLPTITLAGPTSKKTQKFLKVNFFCCNKSDVEFYYIDIHYDKCINNTVYFTV